jgi:tRNA pseudouridine32 synthase/23S rRNA pseudouridine746 synthase
VGNERAQQQLACPPVSGVEAAPAVLYADAALLVALKPAGLLAVPGRGEAGRDCLLARLQAQWPDAEVVHRLDMATSGLMAFGRGKAAQRALSIAFAARQVGKSYTAVAAGVWTGPDEGEIDLPLICDWPNRPRQQVDHTRGKPSLTRYRVLARDAQAGTTRFALEPVTGRSHQLRVHLMTLGHPIVGDTLYAPPDLAERSPRLLLHAAALELPHPVTGERLAFRDAAPF